MVVAVRIMAMMEMTLNEVIGMVAVWDRVMPAASPVFMPRIVSAAGMRLGAGSRIRPRNFHSVLVDVVVVDVVQMSIVQVVYVPRVLHLRVLAARAVIVCVLFM